MKPPTHSVHQSSETSNKIDHFQPKISSRTLPPAQPSLPASQKPILLSSAWVAWGLRPCTEVISPDKLPFPSHSYTLECSPWSSPPTALFHNLSTIKGRWGGSGGWGGGVLLKIGHLLSKRDDRLENRSGIKSL